MNESMVPAVQEGCRWLHNPPTGGEFASWFEGNVQLHTGLRASDYVNGITLIPNKERIKSTRLDAQSVPAIVETERLSFAPYPQVETRVRYFWDFCRENGYVGAIEPVVTKQSSGLPPGVFTMKVPHAGKETIFIGASFQVRVFEPCIRTGGRGKVVMEPPLGTKYVELIGKYGPDVNAVMKAQTGGIGRALGFAGMLVVPGAGISSAEDMLDLGAPGAIASASAPAGSIAPPDLSGPDLGVEIPTVEAEPMPPSPRTSEELGTLEERVKGLLVELAAHPGANEQFSAWARERGLNLENIAPASLRAIERQLDRKIAQAKRK